ncbi:MAG TPA: carboxypeptidase-like regulatory domain-containing protein [Terriglobales bacterium]|nr:carboxypeptidase-like regulatory domain-containing protein [Terriglobales bacterium]
MTLTSLRTASRILLCLTALLISLPLELLAQSGNQGTVAVTVQDSSGALIPNAKLELVESRSNSLRTAATDSKGLYNFVNLNIGTYRLTVSREGYQTTVYDDVLVESSATTTLAVSLSVGAVTQTVNVSAQANALLQTTSTEVGTVINTTDIDNLPISGRAISGLTQLTAGYSGTWNGLPEPAEGTNIDGAVANNGRTKYQGTIATSVSPRIESFEQVSVVTDGLSLGNGFGTATMQLNYISRRGSNQFHGRAYYDFRNDGLNANSWTNDVSGQRKTKLIQHDFGVSVGGPVFRNKLFFFGTYAEFKQPGTQTVANNIFPTSVVNGNYTYTALDPSDPSHKATKTYTVNLFQLASNYSASLPSTINPSVNKLIQNALSASNGLKTASYSDPNLTEVFFNVPGAQTNYYPVARLDYNLNDKVRMYMSWLMTQSNPVGSYPAPFPGSSFANQNGNNFTRNFNTNYGLDYIITPKLINQFKFGFMYSKQQFVGGAAPNWQNTPPVFFNMTGDNNISGNYANRMSGLNYSLPTGYEYPVFSLSNGITYEKGSHSINLGFQGYREQDHYYNPPVGFPNINFGLVTGDPAQNAFTLGDQYGNGGTLPGTSSAYSSVQSEAWQIYAILAGRISSISGSQGYDPKTQSYQPHSFNLDEVALATGIWAQDSWKVRPDLTINYGLRWDFVVDPHDVKAAYHNARLDSILGPTAAGDLFKPGALGGNLSPTFVLNPRPFQGFYKTPQPQVALNWNPHTAAGSLWRRILGDDATSIRVGFGLRNFTQPYQFYWDASSAQALLYYQTFALTANTTGATGTFTPGSVAYGDALPAFAYNPVTFPTTAPLTNFTFINSGVPVEGIKSNIRMPYTESWNFGIQRSIFHNTVLEIRYNGNRTIHNWTTLNYNEVNIFENGFLTDFKNAQANLAASGNKSFSDVGGIKTPIIDAAFANTSSAYKSPTFIGYLQHGAAGSFARQLAGNGQSTPAYFCALVGSSFAPCGVNAKFKGGGAGYPINFFQANPYAPGQNTQYMTDAAYSNYNALQVDLRMAPWRGLQGDFNYTYGKTLGFGTNNNDYLATLDNFYTLRNRGLSYVPQSFDLRHIFHGYGTYELPFGKTKPFLHRNSLENQIFGGFTLGTVIGYQTGNPFLLTGGYDTFNQYDGGVALNGITPNQLQQKVGIHYVPHHTTALAFDPSLFSSASGGTANYSILGPNTTPGTIGSVVWLHGPKTFTQNMELSKLIPIRENVATNLQAAFINVWNHPTWGTPSGTLQSTGFGTSSIVTGARQIELRANFTF